LRKAFISIVVSDFIRSYGWFPRRLNFKCRLLGILCMFHLYRSCEQEIARVLSVCLYVCVSVRWNNSAPTGRIFMKFDFWIFENLNSAPNWRIFMKFYFWISKVLTRLPLDGFSWNLISDFSKIWTRLPLEGFSLNLIFEFFRKIVKDIQFFISLTRITGTLHEDLCTFIYKYLSHFFLEWEMFDTSL